MPRPTPLHNDKRAFPDSSLRRNSLGFADSLSNSQIGGHYPAKTIADDAYLLRQYAETRSETAFAELVERHLALVYHCARRQLDGDEHRAKDVAQTVFVLLAAKAFSLRSHPSLAGWLYTTTHFKASEAQRAERRRMHRETIASALRETVTDHPSGAEPEQLGVLVDQAILELNEQDREAVLLRYFEDQAYAEIATRLLLTEKTAHKRVERALDKLRERLARAGITSTAAALAASLGTQAGMAAPAGLTATVTGAVMASAPPVASLATAIAGAVHAPPGIASVVGIAATLSLVAIGTGVYELRDFFRAQAALKTASARYESEQEQLRGMERSAQVADQARIDLQRKVGQLRTANAALIADTARAEDKGRSDWQRFALAFPEARQMVAAGGKAQLQRNYGLFFHRAGLTPAQIVEFETRTNEFMVQRLAIGPGFVVPTADQLPDDQLRAILGNQAFQEFLDYKRMMPAHDIASSVRSSTADAGAPISADQEEQLAQLIADSCPAYKNGQPMDSMSVDWASANAQAQILLSPIQWQTVEGIFLNLQYQQALAQAQRI